MLSVSLGNCNLRFYPQGTLAPSPNRKPVLEHLGGHTTLVEHAKAWVLDAKPLNKSVYIYIQRNLGLMRGHILERTSRSVHLMGSWSFILLTAMGEPHQCNSLSFSGSKRGKCLALSW